jgi:hypothetical protein
MLHEHGSGIICDHRVRYRSRGAPDVHSQSSSGGTRRQTQEITAAISNNSTGSNKKCNINAQKSLIQAGPGSCIPNTENDAAEGGGQSTMEVDVSKVRDITLQSSSGDRLRHAGNPVVVANGPTSNGESGASELERAADSDGQGLRLSLGIDSSKRPESDGREDERDIDGPNTACGPGRIGGRDQSKTEAVTALQPVEARSQVVVKWEAKWAPETDGWVQVLMFSLLSKA